MVKQGPCHHCGVSNTPLWRNGPPEKPVLCNACGSRWRTKGSLANYTPLHARTDSDEYEDHKGNQWTSLSVNKNAEEKASKRKKNYDINSDYSHSQKSFFEEDGSNRSSSGSAISNSESYAQVGSADYSDLTGASQSVVWESMVPSRKRTCFNRSKPSSVEKLTKDLHSILNEQQSYCLSDSSEEDLIFDSETPMVSVEIGHGSVLIRHPNSIGRDEESEGSSSSVENKQTTISNVKENEQDKCLNDIKDLLGDHYLPLRDVNLNDLLNFEEFGRQVSSKKQKQLFHYLLSIDVAKIPESIKTLFESPHFKECLSSYQGLLAENRDNDTLKNITLSELFNSKWIENPVKMSYDLPETKVTKSFCRRTLDGEPAWLPPEDTLTSHDLPFVEELSDQDLLMDVPCINSFPQAELLNPKSNLDSNEHCISLGYSHLV